MNKTKKPRLTKEQIAAKIMDFPLRECQFKQARMIFEYDPKSALRYCQNIMNPACKYTKKKK